LALGFYLNPTPNLKLLITIYANPPTILLYRWTSMHPVMKQNFIYRIVFKDIYRVYLFCVHSLYHVRLSYSLKDLLTYDRAVACKRNLVDIV